MRDMTDNEIIKALEHNANKCRLYEDSERQGLYKSTLDLINHQKEEIESLKHRKTELQIRNQELQHEKSEAVKEFAERVKLYIDVGHLRPPTEQCFSELDVVNMIDNLVKEMAGE